MGKITVNNIEALNNSLKLNMEKNPDPTFP